MERITRGVARWYLKCNACKAPWAVELPHVLIREFNGMYLGEARYRTRDDMRPVDTVSANPCPHCHATPKRGHHSIMGRVQGRYLRAEDLSPVCDGRCTNARGPSCDCKCKGENHGTQRLVARPTFNPLPEVSLDAL